MVASVVPVGEASIEPEWSFASKIKRSTKGLFSSHYSSSCAVKMDELAPPAPWTADAHSEESLQQLAVRLSDHQHGCPSDEVLKWFLRERNYNVAEAEARIIAMMSWRATHKAFNLSVEDVCAEYSTGKSYLHKHADIYGRPSVVIRARNHHIGEFPMADSKRLCIYMLDHALEQLAPDVDQITWIVDLKGISMSNLDIMFVAFVLDAVPEHYPRRVGQVLFVDAPWLFKAPWEAFKSMLRKFEKLVRFVSRKQLAEEFFTPETLPTDFRDKH